MSHDARTWVVGKVDQEFTTLTDPLRRELLAYCYRMVGSVHEAEDLVQDVYLLAWRGYRDFAGRSSVRTWMYRIATNVCLKALGRAARRPLPSGLTTPSADPGRPLDPSLPEVPWLQPAPDALLGAVSPDPAITVESRQSLRLALVAALQHVPARQRAVLVLRDVLCWRANEVADLLDSTPASVNSLLQRARAKLEQVGLAEAEVTEPADDRLRAVVEEFASAFENADIAALVRLLTDDVVFEMPPYPDWFRGRDLVDRFIRSRPRLPDDMRMIPIGANGQPAYGVYMRGGEGSLQAHAILVLTLTGAGICRITMFHDPGLFAVFGLPDVVTSRH